MKLDQKQRCINVLLGVHLGDAMGVPFEMMTRQEILDATGGEGVTRPRFDLDPSTRKLVDTRGLAPGSTSDDSQLANATAEGLIMAGLDMTDAIGKALATSSKMTLGVRPEHLSLATPGAANSISAPLFANENMGPESLVTVDRGEGARVTARIFTDDHLDVADQVSLSFSIEHVHLFDSLGKRIPAAGE